MHLPSECDLGFSFRSTKSGEVIVLRDGRAVVTLRGETARAFLAETADAPAVEQQQAMARCTGNYKRGNERLAASHPRNHS